MWQQNTTSIASLDPSWHTKSLLLKVLRLLEMANYFDVIVFYHDPRLPALFGLLKYITKIKPRLVLQELFCDITRYRSLNALTQPRTTASFLLHRTLVNTMDAIVVHTTAEGEIYADFFGVPHNRFKFIPYFGYEDAIDWISTGNGNVIKRDYILAVGRHRDFQCFIDAIAGTSLQGVIVAGESDRQKIGEALPTNIEEHYELPWEEYRNFIAHAAIVVIPLHANRWQRALGQIAMFEAMLMRKPVVAAKTFQLADYATDDEVLYYRPGDAGHLRDQIRRLMQDLNLRNRLVQNAFNRVQTEFTVNRYITQLLQTCSDVWGHDNALS